MLKFDLLLLLFSLCACSGKPKEKGCIYPVGPLMVDKEAIEWGYVPAGGLRTDTVLVCNPTQDTLEVAVKSVFSNIGCKLSAPRIFPGQTLPMIVGFRTNDENRLEELSDAICFQVNGEWIRTQEIKIRFYVVGTIDQQAERKAVLKIRPESRDFGEIGSEESIVLPFVLRNEGNSDLFIRKVMLPCGCMRVISAVDRIVPGGEKELEIGFVAEGKEGHQRATVKIFSNDPFEPVKELQIRGFITALK